VISTNVARNAESLRVLRGAIDSTKQHTAKQIERVDQRITRAHCEHEWQYERATSVSYNHTGSYHGYVPVYGSPTDSTTVYWQHCTKCNETRYMEREDWLRALLEALDTQHAAEHEELEAELDSINKNAKQDAKQKEDAQ